MPRALITYGPPRYNDAYSFSGRWRMRVQYVTESKLAGPPVLVPDGPLRDVDVGPGEPRG
jgi:hypothetical protein